MDYNDVIKGAKSDTDLLRIVVEELIKIRNIMEEDLKLKKIQHDLAQRRAGTYPR
jgi:hypothetical protein